MTQCQLLSFSTSMLMLLYKQGYTTSKAFSVKTVTLCAQTKVLSSSFIRTNQLSTLFPGHTAKTEEKKTHEQGEIIKNVEFNIYIYF